MGLLFAGRMAMARVPVVLIDHRPDRAARLNRNGLRLITETGGHRLSVPVALPQTLDQSPELWLFCVKANATESAANWVRRCVPPTGVLLTLQNGLGNGERLAELFGPERVLVGTTSEGATLLGEGVVRHAGTGITRLGPMLPERIDTARAVAEQLQAAGFRVEVTPDWRRAVWAKAIVNAGINPLTALLEVPNGRLLEAEASRWLLHQIAREAVRVARAIGVSLEEETMIQEVEAVCQATAKNRSSMLQDVERGRKTELEAVNGRILEAARKAAVSVPTLEAVTRLMEAKERLKVRKPV